MEASHGVCHKDQRVVSISSSCLGLLEDIQVQERGHTAADNHLGKMIHYSLPSSLDNTVLNEAFKVMIVK